MRLTRTLVLPALLTALALGVFHRAYAAVDLALTAAAAIVLGAGAGLVLASRRVPWPAAILVLAAAVVGGGVAVSGSGPSVELVPDAFLLFLTVGLPAGGLRELLIVPLTCGVVAMGCAVAASARPATLSTLAGPLTVVAAGSLLVLPVGFSGVVVVLFAAAAAVVLLLDARSDVSSMPPLVGTNTEARRQIVWWRPLVQFLPAVGALVFLAAVLPHNRTVDVRRYVQTTTERFADANPLAVAARAPQVAPDAARPLAEVRVDGPTPGRFRLAVLANYEDGGWQQTAEFSITGDTLAPDPIYRVAAVGAEDGRDLRPARTRVSITGREAGDADDFRAVPTAERARTVGAPERVRYAPAAGVLLADDPAFGVDYVADARPVVAAENLAGDVTVGTYPAELARCPSSVPLEVIAAQLSEGTASGVERLARIENFLKVRRVYDPMAPGGQTLRAVERFLEQDFARGNLEVFVSSYALLARCAGVPVRIVVGLAAPTSPSVTYTDRDVTAWVETPLVRAGWVPFDPLPTPDEQRQQAQLARQSDPPPPEPEETETTAPPRVVKPIEVDARRPYAAWALAVVLAVAVVLAIAWTVILPRLVLRRRRRLADPVHAVHGAWAAVVDALVDRDVGVDAQHTPKEVARVAAGRVPVVVPRLLETMAPIVDRVRYSGAPAAEADAELAWAHADAVLERLPRTRAVRTAPIVHPARALARWRSTAGQPTRRAAWKGALPDTALVASGAAPEDIPGVTVAARIGEGSTGTVYRGVLEATREPVAVKVFRYGPGDAGFDAHRFDWEVRIAKTVSGLPHLPVVHDAGITPSTQRPYLVSSLYEGGTLLDRVRRGGPMTEAEVVLIGADLAIALSTLHQLGVVHADVKPENVFSGKGGWVLGDLGSAWLRASRGPAATLTPPYAAPEVWRGGPPTPLADVFSLALTMLFAVTGQVPTASITPSRDEIRDAFPQHAVLERALEPDPRRRPRSAVDFARALRPELAPSHTGSGLTTLSLPTPTVSHRRP